ncbi:MAG: tyrosine-type recombinase/integrase [Thermoguttaceae bacterium]
MAGAIQGPRVFAQESLPSGASWADVQQVLAASQRDRPSDIRDHAILMLLAIYGLRGGEVRTLRLEDFDWERELLFVAGSKTRRTRRYPLSRPVGEAILRYLKEVRPRSLHRNLFLTLHPPFRPLTDLWPVVGKRLRPLAASLRHHGPHALRHACATHLMAEGHSLKEIGDYLGHRNLDSTRIYASRGYVATAPLPTVIPKQPPRFVPYIYSHDDLRRLLQTVDSSQRDQARLEPVTTHMIILLLYGTGLRVSEATRLNRVDVDLEDSLLTIRHTKFHKSRFVPFGPQLGRALARYAARAPLSAAEAPFFTMRTGSRVVPDTLEGHFRSFCTRAGVRRKDESRYQPRLHDLRHSFAVHRLTAWYREGADVQQLLPQLSVYMGHGSLRGTQVYLSMTAELLREANRRFAQYAGKEAEHD